VTETEAGDWAHQTSAQRLDCRVPASVGVPSARSSLIGVWLLSVANQFLCIFFFILWVSRIPKVSRLRGSLDVVYCYPLNEILAGSGMFTKKKAEKDD